VSHNRAKSAAAKSCLLLRHVDNAHYSQKIPIYAEPPPTRSVKKGIVPVTKTPIYKTAAGTKTGKSLALEAPACCTPISRRSQPGYLRRLSRSELRLSTWRDQASRYGLAPGIVFEFCVEKYGNFRGPLGVSETNSNNGTQMTKILKNGDAVSWKSHGGEGHGKVVKRITEPTQIKGHKAAASKDNPQLIVETDEGKCAAHKAEALTKE
jgi:hypothetical protein